MQMVQHALNCINEFLVRFSSSGFPLGVDEGLSVTGLTLTRAESQLVPNSLY